MIKVKNAMFNIVKTMSTKDVNVYENLSQNHV